MTVSTAPPGTVTTRSETSPPSLLVKAMRRPSGDQRGRVWSHSQYVSWKGSPPSAVVSQSWLRWRPR